MPDLNTTRSELEQAFITGWGVTSPIAYDNANYEPVAGTSFVRLSVDFLKSDNVCIGAALAGTSKQRHYGVVKLNVYIPNNVGVGAAYVLSDTYKGIMDNKTIVANLHTLTSDCRRSGEEVNGFWSLVCFTDFYSDEQ